MTRKSARMLLPSILLAGLLAIILCAVPSLKPGVSLWQHPSGHILTQVQWLPRPYWGIGTRPIMMNTATGASINTGTETKIGPVIVSHYDLRLWNYDPRTGVLSYETG